MKKLNSIGLIVALLTSTLLAKDELEIGLSFGGGYGSEKDNMSTENEKVSTKGKDHTDSGFTPAFGVSLAYKDFLVQTEGFEDLSLTYEKEAFFISTSYMFNTEYWKNPYIFNAKREKVSGKNISLDVGYSFDVLDLSYTLLVERVSDTKTIASLKQSGETHSFGVSSGYPVYKELVFLEFGASYLLANKDGAANSYKGYGLSFGSSMEFNKLSLGLNVAWEQNSYDAKNTVFNATREDEVLRYGLNVEVEEGLGFKDTSLMFSAGIEESDSNINFYDKESQSVMLIGSYYF